MDLINGVLRSRLDSTLQQMKMYMELLNNVGASAAGLERTQFSTARFPYRLSADPLGTDVRRCDGGKAAQRTFSLYSASVSLSRFPLAS